MIDVFAYQPLNGNPLALVIDAQELSQETMQRIAREFNQSETTFLLPPTRPQADWRLRCFTPAGIEVSGAGHNALGAWWWLAEAGRLHPLGPFIPIRQRSLRPLVWRKSIWWSRDCPRRSFPPGRRICWCR
jgi:predicted PhzF superfamily epimerase YddE/YHI9